jgi:energy-coupling factor transport system ATP-binding protein
MYKIIQFKFQYSNSSEKSIYCTKEFSLPSKGVVLVSGASGSGKSTFLNLLKGLIPEFIPGKLTGEILYNNKFLTGDQFKRNINKIAFLFQNPFSQIIHHNTADEFYFSLENFQIEFKSAEMIKNSISKKFNLTHLWQKKTNHLSHGECQKLLLASLLAFSPEVLLLDEPTAFLDPYERNNFYEMLDELKKEHLIILTDHHINEVLPRTDLLITVSDSGEILLNDSLNISKLSESARYLMPVFSFSMGLEIHFNNLKFSYDGIENLIDIKNEVIKSGEVIIIKGRNGTGKSTLLKLISGFIVLKNESILIKKDSKLFKPNCVYSDIAFISQNPESTFLFDTLAEELGHSDFGFSPSDLLRSPYLFSEGEKRRISIYTALAQNKNIFLFDEPTFGQDENNTKILIDIIQELKRHNKIQIIISHDENFIELVGDRVLTLKERFSHE